MNHQKPQFEKFQKYPMKCMKTWNKMQREGHNGQTGLERGKPSKNFGGKRQKIYWWALSKSEREKSLKNFLKSKFEQVKLWFLKTWFTIFDWSKISFDWSKQTEASKKFLKQFQLIKKPIGSIEANRGSQNFWEKKQFLKITNTHFRNTSKHWNWWTKCMSMWWNVFQKQLF